MENNSKGKDKLIGSLAILKSQMILGQDFISTYIPFVARVLLNINTEAGIQINDVIEGFSKEYGFTIDRPAMTTLLNKCARDELIKKKKDARYEIALDKCEKVAINMHSVNMQYQKYNEIVTKLKRFYYDEYGIEMEIDEVETKLMSFFDEHSAKTIITKFDDISEDPHSSKQHQYVISKFIKKCQYDDQPTYQLIIDLAISYLFTSAIAYGGDDEQTKIDGYKDLILYLDTPFVLRVLGLNGEEMKDATKVMLDQLYEMNCRFYVFSHTFDEIVQILNDCYKWIEDVHYNAVYASDALRTFVEKKFTKADVQEYIDTLESKLKFYKIKIDEEDYYSGKYYKSQIDEEEIQKKIIQVYRESSTSFDEHSKKATIEFDSKSLSIILKLRNNVCSRTYKQAKYTLLTTNTTLAYVTRLFDEELNPSGRYHIYPCITDVFLGTTMWLGAPINRLESFSEKKLLADCMSIIEPSDELIRRLQDSITKAFEDETITEDQYYLLKSKAFSNDYVMKRTLGDELYFTDAITEEILEDIEKQIVQPYKKEIENLSGSLTRETKEKNDALKEIQAIKSAEQEKKEQEKQKEIGYEERAEGLITNISKVLVGCFVIPIATTIINIAGLITIQKKYIWICIISILILPTVDYLLVKKEGQVHKFIKNMLVKRYKMKDYKRTL